MSCHQNAGLNHDLLTAIKSFANVARFKYLGTTVTNQNDIHKEIKSVLNFGNTCYHSVLNVFLSHNLHIKIYKTIILPVLYGCETCSLTLRQEHRLRVFENRVLTIIYGSKREDMARG
jgi:hypothetical protein